MIISPEEVLESESVLGITDRKKQLQPVSIDLTIAEVRKPLSAAFISEEERQLPVFENILPENNSVFFLPQGCYTIVFNEGVEMPKELTAFIVQRSCLNRSLSTITSSIIDPGYKAERLAASLYVFNPNGIHIEKNCRVASIFFVKSSPKKLYNGAFQNEKNRPFNSLTINGKAVSIRNLSFDQHDF